MPVVFALPFIGIALAIGMVATAIFLVVNQLRFNAWCRAHGLPGIPLRELPGVHFWEFWAIMRVLWWQIRAPLANPGPNPPGRAVLFVHGYTQNSTNFWSLQHAFAKRPTRSIFLGIAWPWRRIVGYGRQLEAALERTKGQVDIVAHSMGGLVLRDVLTRRPDLRPKVHGVVTLGTPHHGTAIARWFTWMHPTRELSYRSDWVERLPTLRQLLTGDRPMLTIGGTADMIVYPVESTAQEGVSHLVLRGVGHAGLLTNDEAIFATVDCLGST